MTKVVAVIDGNSLMHRAYHAVPPTMNMPDGTPTNAVFGFLSMLLKFIDVARPDAIICAFDAGKPAFRMEALEKYKAQRPPMDQELRVQFPLMETLLEKIHIPVVKIQGWEGDDILGTVSAQCEALGYESLLISGDKDVYQLTSDLTRVVTTKKGITDVAIYGPKEVYERYGVTPAQFPDYLGLMGDSSDNIPGVPGVGQKTAAKLLQDYGSIEGIYDHVGEIKGKLGQKVADNKDLAYLSREVATIIRDLDIQLDLQELTFPSYTADEAKEALGDVKINSHLGHLLALIDDTSALAPDQELEIQAIYENAEALGRLEEALANNIPLGLSLHVVTQASLFESPYVLAVALSGDHEVAMIRGDETLDVLADIMRRGRWAAFDAKALMGHVLPKSTLQDALLKPDEALRVQAFDVSLAGYVLDSSSAHYDAASLASAYLPYVMPEAEGDDAIANEACAAYDLATVLRGKLEKDGSLRVFEEIDMPLVPVLVLMERTGASIDSARLAELSAQTGAQIGELKARIWELAGEEFNIDSPMQLSHILFEVMGYRHGKKTQRGYSTDAKVLGELAAEAPIAAAVLEYRELAKIRSVYMEALPSLRADDGRIHTSFNQLVTTTGRLSSSDPNLQNIPVRTDFGRQIRECFLPYHQGDLFVSADYSQIELRLLAHLSGDEGMIEAFNSGADFHASTAAKVFGVAIEDVTSAMRSRAKAVNFGIVYGQQAYGLAQSLGIGYGEAQQIIDSYFEAFPAVRSYLDGVVAKAVETGYAETLFGRKRHIPELKAGNAMKRGFGERTAMNHPMQGTAADIIKLAMNRVQRNLIEGGFGAALMIQVHDELDFSCPADEYEALQTMVRDVMEQVVDLRVPLVVDIQGAPTWALAH